MRTKAGTSGPAGLGANTSSGLADAVRVFGMAWNTVVAVRVPSSVGGQDVGDGLSVGGLLPFTGPLFSLRLVSRGDHDWLVAGAVTQAALARVEPDLP